MLALRARRRTGNGQEVFVSMLGANAYANADAALSYAGQHPRPLIDHQLFGVSPLQRLYTAAGDSWIFLSAESDGAWQQLTRVLGREDLGSDARFTTSASRAEHADALASELVTAFKTRHADEWERLSLEMGVSCVRADDYQSAGRFFLKSPQIEANGFAPHAHHRVMGDYQRWGPMVTFAETPGRYGPGVVAGEHTDSILQELGFSSEDVARLRADGVVWSDEAPPV